ncbi:MAG: flavodoxin family protein [Eggerthellaceae bacterium]|jgi:multimeric flavodoxin WrbA
MSILFINGSPEKSGHTVGLAKNMLAGKEYDELDLVDMKVYGYGQEFDDDQFEEVLARIKAADVVVIGSPVYWHNLSGMVRNLIDRFYGPVPEGSMVGKTLYLLFQGAAPEKWMLDSGKYTMSRFAGLYGFAWGGMATTPSQARDLGKSLE